MTEVSEERECYICLENKSQFLKTCEDGRHSVCSQCFLKIYKCPMCRIPFKSFYDKMHQED